MPPGRDDPAERAMPQPPPGPPVESYASIWGELSEAQRAAILAAIGSTGTPRSLPALRETMHALRRVRGEPDLGVPPAEPTPPPDEPWRWHPRDNGLLAASFDPALIVGGNAPPRGVLVCQQVAVPADAPIEAVLLDVVTAGAGLMAATAAVYELDGWRSGVTRDQSAAWSTGGLQRMPLVEPVAARPAARTVWIGFVATGATLPAFAVPWISKAARPNLGLPSPGPQRAGEIAEQTACPERVTPAEMRSGPQYWVGLG